MVKENYHIDGNWVDNKLTSVVSEVKKKTYNWMFLSWNKVNMNKANMPAWNLYSNHLGEAWSTQAKLSKI